MRRIPALLSILVFAATALAGHSRSIPKERTTIETEPLAVTAWLVEGWSAGDGRLVPPESLRSACRVRMELVRGSDWNTALADAMRGAIVDRRELFKSGGHVAVKYETKTTESVYINLDDIAPATFAVWNVENEESPAGRQCRSEFDVIAHTVSMKLPAQHN